MTDDIFSKDFSKSAFHIFVGAVNDFFRYFWFLLKGCFLQTDGCDIVRKIKDKNCLWAEKYCFLLFCY